MIKFFRKRMNKKGFTLVELLIVIAVLGIIAGIAVPSMSGVTDTFKRKADVETARIAIRQIEVMAMAGFWADGNTFAALADVTSTEYGDALPTSQLSGATMTIAVAAEAAGDDTDDDDDGWTVTIQDGDGHNLLKETIQGLID